MGEFAQQPRDLGPTQEMPRAGIPRRETASARREARASGASDATGAYEAQLRGPATDLHAFTLVVTELRRAVDQLRGDVLLRIDRVEERFDTWSRFHDGLHRELAEESAERRTEIAGRLARVEGSPAGAPTSRGADGTLREQISELKTDFAQWRTGVGVVGGILALLLAAAQIVAQVWGSRPPLL